MRPTPLRVVFMGTPDFAVPTLRALCADRRCVVAGVFTQPDRPAGRGGTRAAPPVKTAALELGCAVAQPERLRDEGGQAALEGFAPDLVVVAAYGQILRAQALALPRLGCVNVHASLLPRWRGAAPIHRAVAAADAVSGVSIMRMDAGLDTGPVYAMDAVMIGDTETAGELHDRLAHRGAALLIRTLDDVIGGAEPTPQPSTRVTTARMLGPADRVVSFDRAAELVAASINGMNPWPGVAVAFDGEPVALLRARAIPDGAPAPPGTVVVASAAAGLRVAAASGHVDILELKRPGRRAMAAADFLRGASIRVGATAAAATA